MRNHFYSIYPFHTHFFNKTNTHTHVHTFSLFPSHTIHHCHNILASIPMHVTIKCFVLCLATSLFMSSLFFLLAFPQIKEKNRIKMHAVVSYKSCQTATDPTKYNKKTITTPTVNNPHCLCFVQCTNIQNFNGYYFSELKV